MTEHVNFGGLTGIFGPGNHNPNSYIDMARLAQRVTSIVVYEPIPGGYSCTESIGFLYEHIHRQGHVFPVPFGIATDRFFDFHDEASSILVPDGMCIRTYEHADFRGAENLYLPGASFLETNDDVSAFRTGAIGTSFCSAPSGSTGNGGSGNCGGVRNQAEFCQEP